MKDFIVHVEDACGNEKTFTVSAENIGMAHIVGNKACDVVLREAVTYITEA